MKAIKSCFAINFNSLSRKIIFNFKLIFIKIFNIKT